MSVGVRYIVSDVAEAVSFYSKILGFTVEMDFSPGFAAVSLGDLRLFLNSPGGGGGAGKAMPDGSFPAPGGWNRIMIETADIAGFVETLRRNGARFRNDITQGNGGKQILLEDPSGNAIEVFEPGQRRQ